MKKLASLTLCILLYSQITLNSQGNTPDRISTQTMLENATKSQKWNSRLAGFYAGIAACCLCDQRPIYTAIFTTLSVGSAWLAHQKYKDIVQLQIQNEDLKRRAQEYIHQQKSS